MKRPFIIIGFTYFIMLGVCIFLPPTMILPLIFELLGLGICLIAWQFFKKVKLWILIVTCFSAALAMSMFLWNYNKNVLPMESFKDRDVLISGEVCDLPFESEDRYYYDLNLKKINEEKVDFKIRISSKEPLEVDVYNVLTGQAHIFLPVDTSNFYAKTFYKSRGIYANAFLYEYGGYKIEKLEKKPFNYHILKFRQKLLSSTKFIFPPRTASLINSVILGEKHELPKDIKKDFERIGVYHFLVVSGLHISIISSFFFLALQKLRLNKRLAAIFSAVFVFAFLALLGFTSTAMRAGFVAIIYFFGIAAFREADSLNSLGVAVFLICIINPNSAADLGLWLSAVSYLGIILTSDKIEKHIREKLKVKWKYVSSSVAMTVSATLFTLPIAALFFGHTSLISVASNLLLFWVMEPLLCFSLITSFIYVIYPMNWIIKPLSLVCGELSNFVLLTSKLLAKIPFIFISLEFGYIKLWLCMVLILVAVVIILYEREKKTPVELAFLLSLNLLLVGIFSYQLSIRGLKKVSVLNCGEGLEVMVSQGTEEFGIIYPTEKTDENALEKYLLRLSTFSSPVYLEKSKQNEETQNCILEKKEIDGKIYIRLEIENIFFLIIPNGGNGLKIPKEWWKPNLLIAGGLPINFQNIKPEIMVLSMNSFESVKNLEKIKNFSNIKAVSTVNFGNIVIDVNKKSGYKLRGAV